MSEQVENLKEASLKFADISVLCIEPNLNNPNEMDDASMARLVDEIRENGFIVPIIVVAEGEKYKILNGEHRWRAAMQAEYKYIPCVILTDEKWKDQELFDLMNIRINEIRGKLSPSKMQPIYEKVVAKYGEDNVKKILGITNDDVYKKMIKKMATSFKKSINSEEMSDKIDAEVLKHKDPRAFTKAVSKIIRDEAEKAHKSNCIIFQSTGSEHVVIKANSTTFSAISEIVRMCQLHNKDINGILFASFSEIVNKANEIFPDTSIDIKESTGPLP